MNTLVDGQLKFIWNYKAPFMGRLQDSNLDLYLQLHYNFVPSVFHSHRLNNIICVIPLCSLVLNKLLNLEPLLLVYIMSKNILELKALIWVAIIFWGDKFLPKIFQLKFGWSKS